MTKKISLLFIYLIIPALAFGQSNSFKPEKLVIRGSNAYEPFEFIDKDGEMKGFNVDIINALMKELQWDYDFKLEEWKEVNKGIRAGNIDIMPGMIYSEERAKFVRFGLPITDMGRNIFTLQGEPYTTLESLRGKRIIVHAEGWSHEYLLKEKLTDKIVLTRNMDESLKALIDGRGDAVIGSDLVAFYSIMKNGYTGIRTYDLGVPTQQYSIVVSKSDELLLYHINMGLQRLKASGEYDRIYNKWFGVYKNRQPTQLIYTISTLFIITLLISFFSVRYAKRKARMSELRLEDTRSELELAIEAGNITAWVYNIETHQIYSLHRLQILQEGDHIEKLFELMDKNERDKATQLFTEVVTGVTMYATFQFCIRKREGQLFDQYYEGTMKRVPGSPTREKSIVGTMKNITADVLSRKELIEMRDKADASNRLKSAFLANMSHEIRTPLNAIIGFSNILLDDEMESTNEEKKFYKEAINTNSELLLNLINDILDLSRIEAGSFSFHQHYFDFSPWFIALAEELKRYSTESVVLVYNSPLNSLWIESDSNRLAQIITNFVTNAFKFTKIGKVTMAYEFKDECLTISVSDTGIGIADDKQSSVFNRFIKLNEFAQGTGLGLPICKAIAKAMGGKIGLTSKLGEGSTFFVSLPCKNSSIHVEYKEK
ncbi:MAG: transporter substrate-binding domain-containing protein [Phocaeicola sp.]